MTPTPRAPLAAAGCAVLALLAALHATVGTAPAGRLAAVAAAAAGLVLLARALRRSGAGRLGVANGVTLARAVPACGVAALAAGAVTGADGAAVRWAAVALAVPALLLDAVDGAVARRTGSATALGARFDGEVDAFLILGLSVLVVAPVGPWAVAAGLLRYVFWAAALPLPWLAGPLPPRYSRKVVAAVQGVVLVTAVPPVLPGPVATAAVAAALAALCWSFGRDVALLAGASRGGPAQRARGGGARPGATDRPAARFDVRRAGAEGGSQHADGLHSRGSSANHGTGTLGSGVTAPPARTTRESQTSGPVR